MTMTWWWSRTSRTTIRRSNRKAAFPVLLSLRVTACISSFLSSPAFAFAASTGPRLFSGLNTPKSRPFSASTTNSLKMSSSNLEKEIADYNSCTAAALTLSNAYVVEHGGHMFLRVTRSVEDIDNDKKRNYEYTLPIPKDIGDNSMASLFQMLPPTEVSTNIQAQIPSKSGKVMAVIRADDAKDDKTPARQVLEVWSSDSGVTSSLVRKIALPTELHGKVIIDPTTFGRPSWGPDEKVLVYAAERKKPETTSFFDPKVLQDKDYSKIPGGQHTLGLGRSEGWGEQLSSLEPLFDLFLVNIETGRVAKVENVPGSDDPTSLGSYTLGTPIFSPDGKSLVYTGWDAGGGQDMPKRLGLVYCFQRASKLYASSIRKALEFIAQPAIYPQDQDEKVPKEESSYVCLTPSLRLAKAPRFSPYDDEGVSKLVFLASEEGFDTHFGHFRLHAMEWKDGVAGGEEVLVKQRWNIREGGESQEGVVEQVPFPGLALVGQLPEQCFISPHVLVTSTTWGSSFQIVRVSLKDGSTRIVRARIEGTDSRSEGLTTQELLCVVPSGGIVVKESAPNKPGDVAFIMAQELLKADIVAEGALAVPVATLPPLSSSSCAPVPTNSESVCGYSYQVLTLERPGDDGNKWNAPIQSILMLPHQKEGDPKPPLICLPHGGPHSVSAADYMPTWSFLCGQSGYALLLVNYRGSMGFGQDAVEDLPSRIADLDMKDVVHAVKHVADSGLVDPERLGICGGSHGGFLTGHLIGQYPDLFKAACMRNPVTNIASMITSTDIPDWCIIECCGLGQYDWRKFTGPSAEQLAAMYAKSPIAHSQHVRVPTLIALGMRDLRVPPSQGLEYYHILRSKGVAAKLLMYDDCDHPIGAVNSKADHWLNIKRWFDEHMQ